MASLYSYSATAGKCRRHGASPKGRLKVVARVKGVLDPCGGRPHHPRQLLICSTKWPRPPHLARSAWIARVMMTRTGATARPICSTSERGSIGCSRRRQGALIRSRLVPKCQQGGKKQRVECLYRPARAASPRSPSFRGKAASLEPGISNLSCVRSQHLEIPVQLPTRSRVAPT